MSLALVTGAAKGLGRELSISLGKRGYPLLLHYNKSEEEVFALQSELLAYGVKSERIAGDFSTLEGIDDFLNRLSAMELKVKYLVNNVGLYARKSLLQTSKSEWLSLFNANLHLPFLLCQTLAPLISEEKGAIANVGVAGLRSRASTNYDSAYTITKEALYYMTKMLAKELVKSGVTVNMISPGYLPNSVDKPRDPDLLPMGRCVAFSEVADLLLYLFSEQGKSITGQNIEVAGGVAL